MLEMQEVASFLRETNSGFLRAATKAQLATIKKAEVLAKQNAAKQFTGRNDRRLSGRLLNSIYSGLEENAGGIPVGVLGVRNVPYGAIHEYGSAGLPGGVIKPKASNKMQRLWIPNRKVAGRMTPREFIQAKQAHPGDYFLNDKVAGKWINKKTRRLAPIFFLVKQVAMPERPYLRPAMEMAMDSFPGYFEQFIAGEIK